MVGDMAVEQPGPDIIRMHIDNLSGRGEQLDRVGPRTSVQHRIAMPVSRVDIVLVAEADQIPAHALSATHSEAVEIAVKQPVNGVLLVGLLELAVLLAHGPGRASETLDIGVQ